MGSSSFIYDVTVLKSHVIGDVSVHVLCQSTVVAAGRILWPLNALTVVARAIRKRCMDLYRAPFGYFEYLGFSFASHDCSELGYAFGPPTANRVW